MHVRDVFEDSIFESKSDKICPQGVMVSCITMCWLEKQGFALTQPGVTVLSSLAVSAAGPATRPARRRTTAHAHYRRQQTTDDADRRQRARQYWRIRRDSKK